MQRFLTKLTAEQAEQQHQRLASEAAAAAASFTPAPPVRRPGRPRKSAPASLLTPASAPAAATSSDDENPEPLPTICKRKRGYTSWLTSDDFHLIHEAVMRRQSFRKAATELKERFPRLSTQDVGKFALLHAGTLRHGTHAIQPLQSESSRNTRGS